MTRPGNSTRVTSHRPSRAEIPLEQSAVGAFAQEFPANPGALARVRQRFDHWLSELLVDPEDRADLLVALSELAANAVAASAPRTCVSVRAQRKAGSVVLEVENAPESDAAISLFYDNDDPVRGRGRGLTIVSAYTDLVEVILPHGEHGLVVRCRKQCTWSTGQPAR